MARSSEVEHEFERADEPKEPAPPRSSGKLMKFGVPVLLVLIAVGVYFWLHSRNRESTDDAQVDGHIAPISAKISGAVIDVPVKIQQHVDKGQVLVRLDPRDYQARVDQAKAALAVAEAQAHAAAVGVPLTRATTASGTSGAAAQVAVAQSEYERAQVGANQAQTSGIAAAQAQVAQAEANNQRAQADLARMRPLIAKQEISQQQFDSYVAAANVAAAQLRAAQEQLNASRQAAQNAAAAV
jgi:membrane fusion protein, multidrug efflux system